MPPERSATAVRTHVLLIVLFGALLPLGALGFWLSSSAIRAGETLLKQHLDESASAFATAVQERWKYRYGNMGFIANNQVTIDAIQSGTPSAAEAQWLAQRTDELRETIQAVELRRNDGSVVWSAEDGSSALPRFKKMRTSIPIVDSSGSTIGEARFAVLFTAIVPADTRTLIAGGEYAIRERGQDIALQNLQSAQLFPADTFRSVAGKQWRAVIHRLESPPLDIAIAAPLVGYTRVFERNAQIGTFALVIVSIFAVLLTLALTLRVTRPLERLAEAADAVSQGNLERDVGVAGPAEVRRLGRSFNAMIRSLRETLETLSQRNALAAVGEFATALSHDVRNALTSIKLDLQRVSRRKQSEEQSMVLVNRALNSVMRLEAAVTGALRVARGARMASQRLDLRDPIHAAASMVEGAFAAVPARLDLDLSQDPIWVNGDASALEQLFSNLLFNSAQALGPGGFASVGVERNAEKLNVIIRDNGAGMGAAEIRELDKPFRSSKREGTGLGLPIARQIATAHGGQLLIESEAGKGTTVTVQL